MGDRGWGQEEWESETELPKAHEVDPVLFHPCREVQTRTVQLDVHPVVDELRPFQASNCL